MAQRALMDGGSLCSLCGARVSDSAAKCAECGSPFDGSYAALSCPFCGAVTPKGPACSICGSALPNAGASPLPASWTAGEVETVPKRKEKKREKAAAPLEVPKAEEPESAKPSSKAKAAAHSKPGPPPAPPPEVPERPHPAASPVKEQHAPPASHQPQAARGMAFSSPQIPVAAKSPLVARDPTLVDIETSQMEQKLATLLLRINTVASKRDLLALREACISVTMVLDNAGIRPPTDEHEPLVSRKRVEEVARRLRDADARKQELEDKVKQLEKGVEQLMGQIAENQKQREAANLLGADEFIEEGYQAVLRRSRLTMVTVVGALEKSKDAEAQKALKMVQNLIAQIDEVLGKEE